MSDEEIVREMAATKAAIELVEQTGPDDKDGLAAMRQRMRDLRDMLSSHDPK